MAENQEGQEGLRFAYDQLRKEILQNDIITIQILGFILIFTGALIGFAASAVMKDAFFMKAILFLFAEGIAFIGMLQAIDRGRSTILVGSYLRIFHEPYMEYMQWE